MAKLDASYDDKTLRERIARLELLCLDVDGVLSNGGIYYSENGASLQCFHARDGYGIRALHDAGVVVALISGRSDQSLVRRAHDLDIKYVRAGCDDKASALRDFCAEVGCTPENAGHMGDDVPDIPAMRITGIAAAPADAHAEVLAVANWTSTYRGGKGAVRQLCDLIVSIRKPS